MKEKILKLIQENPNIYNCLIEDIETYLQSQCDKTKRSWKYSNLNLNKEEILELKEMFKNNKNINNQNIEVKLEIYLDKIKYKLILRKYYNDIEEIIKDKNITNRIKEKGIFTVGELIELSQSELQNTNRFKKIRMNTINQCLKEKNIIFLDDPKKTKQMLQQENAGIIKNDSKIQEQIEKLKTEIIKREKKCRCYEIHLKHEQEKIKILKKELKKIID